MGKESLRVALSTGVALGLVTALCAPGCGGSSSRKVIFEPDAGLGDAGEGGAAGHTQHGGAGGQLAHAGAAGMSVGGNGGAAGDAGATASVAGESGAGPSAGAGGAPSDTGTDIDAGIDCIAPHDGAPLSAASAGLPSAGLALWLRADHGVYKTTANRVCAWADQSAQGALMVPDSEDTRPLWVASGIGTAAAIHFDQVGRYLVTSGVLGIAAQSARTFIAVVQSVNTTARCETIEQGLAGGGEYLELDANTFETVGSREGIVVMNNAYDSGLATSTSPRVHIYTLNSMTVGAPIDGAVDYRVNGATQTLTRTGGSGHSTFEDFSGANYTAVGACADQIIAEALVYDRALSVPERVSVEVALEARYGIQ